MKRKTNIIILSLITSQVLQAAQIPNIGTALKEVKPQKIEREQKEIPQIGITEEQTPKEFRDDKKVKISKFLISGAIHVSNQELKKIVSPFENQELSFKDIQELTSLITKVYRQKGYFVARAYVPQQNIFTQNRSLKINIVEGNYGKFTLENSSLVKDSIIQGNLDDIKDKNIISTNTLERAMLIINDTPGVSVTKAEVSPGEKVGTSDFIIGTEKTKKYDAYISADNYGSQYTGKHRLIAGFDINSPSQIGDKISIVALTSEEAGLLNGRISYNFPIASNGSRGEISFSKTTYELGSTYKALDALGSSDSLDFRFSYPYIKSRLETLDLYFETSFNKMKDEVHSTNIESKKNSYVATLGLNYSKDSILFHKNSQTKSAFSFTIGNLDFNSDKDKIIDERGANTEGTFSKINLELGQDFILTDQVKWENSFQAQYALGNKNLDGSQDLSIGGINGVKFYPNSEESAENGYIFNTELFYSLPTFRNLSSKISLFYDVGRTYMSQNISDEKSRTLQDFGIGYYAFYNNFFLNAHFAHNIAHEVTSQDKYSNKLLFQAGWVF